MTSLDHNRELMTALLAKAGNPPRFPPVSQQAECLPLDTSKLPPFAYNPSIFRTGDKTLLTYRYHFAGDFRTKLGLAQLTPDGAVQNAVDLPLKGNSLEDARLFTFRVEAWLSGGESEFIGQAHPKSVVKYAPMSNLEESNQVMAGAYTYMPLGLKALKKATQIVREEMDAAGAIELAMPSMS